MSGKRKTRRRIRPEAARALIVLVVLALCLYISLATAFGTFIAEKVVAPLFTVAGRLNPQKTASLEYQPDKVITSSNKGSEQDLSSQQSPVTKEEDNLLLSPDADPIITGKDSTQSTSATSASNSEEISIEACVDYLLQLGAYSSIENANTAAEELRLRGAAGYVYSDGEKIRVFASSYSNEAEIKKVMERLKKEQGIDSSMFKFESPSAKMRVTASSKEIKAVKDAFSALEFTRKQLYSLCTDLDKEVINESKARETLKDIVEKVSEPIEALGGSGSGELGTILYSELEETSSKLTELADSSVTGKTFGTQLKYNLIRQIDANMTLMKKLTAKK